MKARGRKGAEQVYVHERTKGKCGSLEKMLRRVLHVKVGFVTFFVHSTSEKNPFLFNIIVNMVCLSFF